MFFRDLLLKAQTPYSSNQLFNWGLGTSGQLGYGILPGSFTQIVGGPSHAAGITSTGSLMLWGLGTNGQLGDTFALTRSNPVQVPGVWLTVAVGDLHTTAVRGDNRLFAWGLNASGQIGDGTTINKSSPVQIGALSNWARVGAGFSNTYATTLAGTLYGWGVNNAGQVGDSTTVNRSSPVIIGASTSWSTVSAGTSFATAIRSDGTLYAWGLNSQSQLGNALVANQSSPIQIGLNNSWRQVSAGQSHTSAVRNDGTLWVWGIATAISLSGNQAYSWTKIASGSGSHSAAIRSDGSLWTWGLGASGQIGDGQTLTRSSPTVVGVGSWIDVAVGPSHTAAVASDGKLFGWGFNTSGQIGDNTVINKSSPVQLAAGTSFINVALGTLHGLALNSASRLYAWGQQASVILGGNIFPDINPVSQAYNNGENGALIRNNGDLFAWGYNVTGTVGDGTTISKSSPVQVAGSWTKLSVGSGHILGIKSGGTLWAWGANTSGQLGLGTTIDRSSPVQIGVATNWSTISAGTNFSLATNSLGQIYAWGVNNLGQLGDGTSVNKSSPVNYGSTSWTAVSAGSSHSLAISSDGNLFTWGYGLVGNLGHNNTQNLSNPTQVTTVVRSWTQVAAGWLQSHAITTLGEKYGWGGNGGGQLGINSNTSRSVPTIVPGSTSWTQVAANLNSSYAIDTLGKLYSAGVNNNGSLGLNFVSGTVQLSNYTQITSGTSYNFISAGGIGTNAAAVSFGDMQYYAWGVNTNGQIGNGDTLTKIAPFTLLGPATSNFSTPTIVGSDYFSEITAGVSYSVGLKTDYTLWSWGLNGGGQLGIGDIVTRSSPTQIGNYFNLGPLSYTHVSAGASHALATSSTNKLYLWGINTSTLITNQVFSWTQLAVGQLHGVAIRNDGALFAWGTNAQGQLGNNTVFAATNSPILVSTSSWSIVAAGASNTSAIKSDGTLWAWGDNTYGQLGQGDTGINRSVPTQIGVATNWTNIANGNYSLMAIDTDGKLYGVGINTNGSLGVGDLNNRSTITIVPGSTSWGAVSAGNQITGAIDTGNNLWMFGLGTSGQIGNGTAATRSAPTQITGNTWSKVSVGSSHVIAIRSDTTLWAWGIGTGGQLGQGTTAVNRSSPVLVAAAGIGGVSSYTQISAGLDFNVALKSNGTLWGWGINSLGQFGINDSINRSTPVQIATGTSFTAIGSFGSGLNQWAGAIATNNTVYNWGFNTSGQIADSTSITKSSPVQLGSTGQMGSMSHPVQIGTSSWTAVAAGTSFSLAIRSDNTLWGWGLNTSNQLGDNTIITKSSPVQVSGGGTSSYTQVAATAATGFGIQNTSLLYGWGLGTSGQVGDITILTKAVPTNVGNLNTGIVAATGSPYQVGSGSSYTQVGAGLSWTTALRSDGAVFAWGLNSTGQIGQGNVTTYSSPVQIGTSSYAQISAGGTTWYGILGNRLLLVVGQGTTGQLGDASLVNKSTPVLVVNTVIASSSSPVQVGLLSWTKVSAGSTHTAAIRSDGLLFEWGSNINGPLATTPADTINRSSPIQVGTSSWTAVSVGKSNFTLGILSNNSLWAWGLNAAYQLGLGDSVDRSSPVQISSAPWNKISAGLSAAGAIDNTGALYMWGTNTSGILGDNQTAITARSVPLQIGTSSWSQIDVGLSHALAIDTFGRMFAWGLNTGFRLGDGTSITKSSPVLVGGSNSWLQISAGADHSVAIKSDLTLWAWGNGATGALGIVSIPYSWTQIAQGNSHSVGLRSDNTIWSWGRNDLGQLGLRDAIVRSSPVQIGTGNSWTFVYTGWYFSGAIRNDGALFTWGYNNAQQLGDGTAINKSSPVQVLGTYSFSQASAGFEHTIAIGANNVGLYTWGPITSTLASAGDLSYSQISEGAGGHTVAIRWDGYLFAWGNNSVGQLGVNAAAATFSSPVQVGTFQYSLVSAGLSHTLAVDSDGRLWAWGLNNAFQLGTGDTISYSSPMQVGVDSSWIGIAAGFSHSMAIRSDGLLFAWGAGISGQQGALTETKSWSNISAGATHALGVSSSKLYAWGLGTSGQLGTGDAVTRSSPVLVGYDQSYVLVNGGGAHTVSTQSDSTVWAVGLNASGQLGDNTTTNRVSPVPAGGGFVVVDSSPSPHTVNKNGTKYSTTLIPVPGTISGIFNGTTDLLSTVSTDYVLDGNFTVECWYYYQGPSPLGPVRLFNGTDGTNIWFLKATNAGFSVNRPGFASTITTENIGGGLSVFGNGGTVYTGAYTTYQWVHLAVTRVGAVYTAYFNGVAGTTFTSTTGTAVSLTTGSTTITVGQNFKGYVSNMRVVKGVAVYTGNFTAPSLGPLAASGAGSSSSYPSTTNVNTSFAASSTILLMYSTLAANIIDSSLYASSISAGLSFSGAINTLGKLFTWGVNSAWQLGTGDSVNRSSPTQISFGTSSYTQVSLGASTSAAIDTSGQLWAWGTGTGGQLAQVSNVLNQSFPVQVAPGTSWSNISMGYSHTLAVKSDGTLWAWGKNSDGQLGIWTSVPAGVTTSSPVQVPAPGTNWSSISAGVSHSLGIQTNGTIWGWGANDVGQVGYIPPAESLYSWTQVKMAINSAAGVTHVAAIRSDGSLWTWGNNTVGQLGLGDSANRSSPVQVGGLSNYSQVALGASHTLAIRSDNTLWGWGGNANWQLGQGAADSINRSAPVQIAPGISWTSISAGLHSSGLDSLGRMYYWGNTLPLQNFVWSWSAISAGGSHTVAIRNDGKLFTWGLNNNGQLGDGTTLNKSSPNQIGASSWSTISAGGGFTLAVKPDGTLWSWGFNTFGQIGVGDAVNRSSPVQVTAPSVSWSSVSGGGIFSAAIDTTGLLYAWGLGSSGELGLNDAVSRSIPTQIGTSSWSIVSAGNQFTMAIDSSSKLFSFGSGLQGRLGQGNTVNYSSPVQIGTSNWSKVSAGTTHAIAIRSDSTLWAWGNGTNGELGYGSALSRSSPVQIGTSSWTSVAAAYLFSTAITVDGKLFTWGLGTTGETGFNTIISRSSPVQVLAISAVSFSLLGASNSAGHAAAISTLGLLYTWGTGNVGQLGVGDLQSRSSPVNIGTTTGAAGSLSTTQYQPSRVGTSSWSAISAGYTHQMAIRADGALFTWGNNTSGQLGTGNVTTYSSPVQIGTSSWSLIQASTNFSYGVWSTTGALYTWGVNTAFECGRTDAITRSSPVLSGAATTVSFSQLSAGHTWGIGITTVLAGNYALYTWGASGTPETGASGIGKSVPVQLGTATSWTAIGGSAAINNNATLYIWGTSASGQQGEGTTYARSSPVILGYKVNIVSPVQIASGSWTQVEAGKGSGFSLATDSTGTFYGWGQDSTGQIGI